MTVVVTGGCGYIGSHVTVRLLETGYDVLAVDDFSNCRADVPARIAQAAGRKAAIAAVDVTNEEAMRAALEGVDIEGVIHLAGRKSVAESVRAPLAYYHTNVTGTIVVRSIAQAKPFVFSSSATVYGNPSRCPIDEDCATVPVNPYGQSKLMSERVLIDSAFEAPTTILRYFNPIGAHRSGLIGDDPDGPPQNLMPCIERVAVGLMPSLTIHGNDYATRDGTAIRDYVHVEDLADAHVRALERETRGVRVINLGSSQGYTVREVVQAFERVTGVHIDVRDGPRRDGDIAAMWADASRAKLVLDWQPRRSLDEACADALRWRRTSQRLQARSSEAGAVLL